jgi:recyclin-1
MSGGSFFEVLVPAKVGVNANIWTVPSIVDKLTEFLSVADLCSFAQVSRACRDAVYRECLWEVRLQNVNVLGKAERTGPCEPLQPLTAFDAFEYPKTHPRIGCVDLFRCLGPLYYDLVLSSGTPMAFRRFRDPIDQAKLLGQLRIFSNIDPLEDNHEDNISKLTSTIDLFESAALSEFETGLDQNQLSDKVKKYASVLITLNGGDSCVQLFSQKHPLVVNEPKEQASSFIVESSKLDTAKLRAYLKKIADKLNEDGAKIDSIFPSTTPVIIPLFERILEDNIMETISSIIEITSKWDPKDYLSVVPQIYSNLMWFKDHLQPCANSGPDFPRVAQSSIDDFYSLYVNSYLDLELESFIDYAETEVEKWSQSMSDQEAATESFLWSNVNKEKDKSDFLSSFKKVLMMPVSAMSPSSPGLKSQGPASSGLRSQNASSSSLNLPFVPSRQSQPSPFPHSIKAVLPPSTELDAMMAVMNNKLEGIKTLFSLELALNLIRSGKESIERMDKFVGMENTHANSQCETVFVELINALGGRHVKRGFDKAIETLNLYDPKQHRKTIQGTEDGEEREGVEPLAIFAELVNIGDLIQQMIHVFFEEELALRHLVDRLDFLSPSVKSKKKFEQMLDDCVANGLSRGIDVLIDQIDFLFVTVQLGSDFCPLPGTGDIGPTTAAKKVVTLLSSHMTLLVGSTEKSVIEVFQQEVGLRFFGSICKHIKRQTINIDGALALISDLNFYYDFILALRQRELVAYFAALKEVGQLFLIDGKDAKALGGALSDMVRFRGVLKPEELLEFVQRRQDWPQVKKDVERVMYGFGIDCLLM